MPNRIGGREMSGRIEALDWLRGLMALSIMTFHLTGWLFAYPDSSSLLGRLGIYGVSIFFILSGLSMAIVYAEYMTGAKSAIFFYIRRAFRIWPLLWICVALAVLFLVMTQKPFPPRFMLLVMANLTTVFGFVSPGAYINTGAWSIGNEVVYYALTPPIIAAFKKSLAIGNAITLIALIASLAFAFLILSDSKSLAEQWATYINPFNNLFLYVAGIAIYFNLKNTRIRPIQNGLLFSASLAFFLFYPTHGDRISIVTGINRVLFLAFSVLLVVSFYKFSSNHLVPRIARTTLEQLGLATYGIYLLHPLVKEYFELTASKLGASNGYLTYGCTFAGTIALSLVSFNLLEKRLMALGRSLTRSDVSRRPIAQPARPS